MEDEENLLEEICLHCGKEILKLRVPGYLWVACDCFDKLYEIPESVDEGQEYRRAS